LRARFDSMITQIINNPLTRQGSDLDVEALFSIDKLTNRKFTAAQLKALTAVESLPRKVVSYLAEVMGNVAFSVSLRDAASGYATEDLRWITNQLQSLSSWMVETQIKANTVGKAYLVIDADRVAFDVNTYTVVNQEIPVSPVDFNSQERSQLLDGGFSVPTDSANRYSVENSARNFTQVVPDERIVDYFPLSVPIEWENEKIERLTAYHVLSGDEYVWSSDRKYLYRKSGDFQGSTNGFGATGIDGVSRYRIRNEDVLKWANSKLSGQSGTDNAAMSASERIQSAQYEVIEASHLIELTAFDYQDDIGADTNDGVMTMGSMTIGRNGRAIMSAGKEKKVTFRLARFASAFLRYITFVNLSLNRYARSEFLAYAKDGLGDINLDIARALATQNGAAGIMGGQQEVDPLAVIQAEMERILKSSANGLVMYDAKHRLEMIPRTFAGVDKLYDVFSADLIGASGLTEFTLFGKNNAGAGLASLDIRDRKMVADSADNLWADHWMPTLSHLARQLAHSVDSVIDVDDIVLSADDSFKLTQQETGEWLKDQIEARVPLIELGVFSAQEIRDELLRSSELGNSFNITVEPGSRAPGVPEAAGGANDNSGNSLGALSVSQGDAVSGTTRSRNLNDAIATNRIWQALINTSTAEIEAWMSQPLASKRDSMRVLKLLSKPVSDWSRKDINLAKTEITTLKRLKGRYSAGQTGIRMMASLANHGYMIR
jgi:hypothetical protein